MHLRVPLSSRCTLVYMDSVALTEGAVGVGTAKLLRLNAPYDVDPALASTSVAGFSEMAGFYQSYRVTRATVHASFNVYGTGGIGSIGEISLFPVATSSVPSNARAWMVQRNGTSKTVCAAIGAQSCLSVPELKLTVNFPRYLGLTRQQWLTDHQYTAATTAIPNKLVFIAIGFRSGGVSTSTPGLCTVTARVAMEVQFFDPVVLSN